MNDEVCLYNLPYIENSLNSEIFLTRKGKRVFNASYIVIKVNGYTDCWHRHTAV
jgi:hypothetical protein